MKVIVFISLVVWVNRSCNVSSAEWQMGRFMVISSQCLSEKKGSPCLRFTWRGRWAKSWAPQKAEFQRSLRVDWGKVYFEFCSEELKFYYHDGPPEKVRNCNEKSYPVMRSGYESNGNFKLRVMWSWEWTAGLHFWVNERPGRWEQKYYTQSLQARAGLISQICFSALTLSLLLCSGLLDCRGCGQFSVPCHNLIFHS